MEMLQKDFDVGFDHINNYQRSGSKKRGSFIGNGSGRGKVKQQKVKQLQQHQHQHQQQQQQQQRQQFHEENERGGKEEVMQQQLFPSRPLHPVDVASYDFDKGENATTANSGAMNGSEHNHEFDGSNNAVSSAIM